MIYLDSSIITIPNLLAIESSEYTLVIRNNITNIIHLYNTENVSENELYYQFNIDTSTLANNEYTVSLYDDSSQCLGKYLAQKGISSYKDVSSFINDTQYIQFN